jgi:hypothetical protein
MSGELETWKERCKQLENSAMEVSTEKGKHEEQVELKMQYLAS